MIFVWGESIGNFVLKYWFVFVWYVVVMSIGTIILSLPVLVKELYLKQGLLLAWKYMDKVARLLVVDSL